MAMTRGSSPDPVTLASLHAALDGIVEIEALFDQIRLPIGKLQTGMRLQSLATAVRTLLVDLLRAEPV
jgi:hypothetical protein